MTTRTAKAIFLLGTLSSGLLFLVLTWDTHRQIGALTHADRLSDEVVAGKRAFEQHNCNDCHTMLGFGGYYAPDLTRVYSRKGEPYVRAVISDPDKVLAKSFRKMPHQRIGAVEMNSLVAFFKWTNEIDTHDWPPQDHKKPTSSEARRLVSAAPLSRGAALFKANGCFSCHKLGGVGGDAGPALDDVGSRMNAERIQEQIANSKAFKPDSVMPSYSQLPAEDLRAMAEFMSEQGGGR
ncbi:MAG: cytochrome c [Armatimonadota bacterium]|nr:cytochrome c [Armatimonadota bacterium]